MPGLKNAGGKEDTAVERLHGKAASTSRKERAVRKTVFGGLAVAAIAVSVLQLASSAASEVATSASSLAVARARCSTRVQEPGSYLIASDLPLQGAGRAQTARDGQWPIQLRPGEAVPASRPASTRSATSACDD